MSVEAVQADFALSAGWRRSRRDDEAVESRSLMTAALAGVATVSILFLTCGLPGSGRTTLARRLEREWSALRLTADEWLHEFHPNLSGDELDAMRDPVERVRWSAAVRVLETGGNVVLDWGLWSREERDHYRTEAQALGAQVVLCVLDPPSDELRRRLSERNGDLPRGTFHITQGRLDDATRYFQRPTAEELAELDPSPAATQQ
ncbi:AAA family ATPase [Streptomyces sp. NPDC088251]|uniref:AAA family ATPase n=1 Tax=unclassified Streptomyces TaxID=2593676 RepID=UPI0037F8B18A